MAQVLDAEKAERKVWVVKAGQATVLHLPGDAEHPVPSVLHMNPNRDSVETSIISFELAATGSLQGPKVDGVVHKRYDAAPVNLTDTTPPGTDGALGGLEAGAGLLHRGSGRPQVDPAYLQNSRKRLAAAAAAKPTARKVVLIDDVRTAQKLEGGQNLPIWSQRRDAKQKSKPVAREDRRRVRMARDELEQELLRQFEKQPHWHFMALQKELDQPAAYLKEVLNELAMQVKRGPHKDLWELKKHLAVSK
eukprot:gene8782-8960_t